MKNKFYDILEKELKEQCIYNVKILGREYCLIYDKYYCLNCKYYTKDLNDLYR